MKTNSYDVIVIGAGHAGSEAALAAARMGCSTLLLTISLDKIALMPCNPAVGGAGRGQLVREIDALGGEMGKMVDATTIHSRRANTSRGPAVQAPFAVVDKRRYQLKMKYLLEWTDNLTIRQTHVNEIRPAMDYISVISAFGEEFFARAVVVTTGTFLGGEVLYGNIIESAGRYGEISSSELSESLQSIGFRVGRFKTGSSPRILARGIDFSSMEPQLPDKEPEPFSFWGAEYEPASVTCHKTHTTDATRRIIAEYSDDVQTCSASIKATGTRYCPSIEDRIMLHPERDRHPIFLQPYGIDHSELYIQGLSTSIPPAAQQDLVRSVAGLESAQIMRPGYAVVYDFICPDQLYPTLETKLVSGLYTAGQINGTSGYEEAAAQGLIAGINAALKVKGEEPFLLDRSQAYIGVLIDDLVTKGVDEPYRMFTSRAEYRLLLRSDNADIRLSKYGYELGLLSEDHYSRVREKETVIAGLVERQKRGDSRSVAGNESGYPMHVEREVEAIILYEGFIDRELKKIAAVRSFEDVMLPDTIDYSGIGSLSAEAVEKLSRIRPVTLAQAMRIPGLRQTDMQVLQLFTHAFHVKRDEEEID